MTINKKLSFVAAATLLSVSAFAVGHGSLVTNPETMASELLLDNNKTVASDVNATYKPDLNAGVDNGKLVINLTNATINEGNLSNTYVYNAKQGMIVTKSGTQATGNNGAKIILDINNSINAGDTLYLVDGTGGKTPKTDLNLTISQGAKSASMTMEIVNNNDATLDISNSRPIMTIKKEWTASIKKSFDGLIDAANSFGQFINNDSSDSTTKDTAAITLTNTTLTHPASITGFNFYVKPDNNVSTMGTFKLNDGTTTTAQDASNEYNTTIETITAGRDVNASFTDTNKTKISPTTFTVSAMARYTNGSKYHTILPSQGFGQWKIYGYTGIIPNATSSKAANIQTVFTYSNLSSISVNPVITLTAANGTQYNVDLSKSTVIPAQLAAGKTVKYNLSDLIAVATDSTGAKAPEGSYTVQFVFPTTPSKIIGYASFRNDNKNAFKDLPIYSNITNLQY